MTAPIQTIQRSSSLLSHNKGRERGITCGYDQDRRDIKENALLICLYLKGTCSVMMFLKVTMRGNYSKTTVHLPEDLSFPSLNTCCFLFTQEVTRFPVVKCLLKCSNLNDIELLLLAGAKGRLKANQAVIQDSPSHLQSILAQSQLKLAGSMEGHQFLYKSNAILKSKAISVWPSMV